MEETKLTSSVSLPEKWSNFLVEQPETGMGYQSVEVTLADGKKVDGIVLNGQVLETIIPIKIEDISSMRVR